MGSCASLCGVSRQDRFAEVTGKFTSGDVSKLKGDAGGMPQMATGRISASDGVITSPVSGSPCVGYFYEISECVFTGNVFEHRGYGFKKIFAEKKNNAFEICDPAHPDIKVQVPAYSANTSGKLAKCGIVSVEVFTDVAIAHVCPHYGYNYDVPHVINGDIAASENLIRGHPLKFGMLDGEGTNTRVEVPESIEMLLSSAGIDRCVSKGCWASFKERLGFKQDHQFRTFVLTEMCLRVNDQVNIIAAFENDSSLGQNVKNVVPLSRKLVVNAGDKESKWSQQTRAAVFKLTCEDKVICIAKFPKVGSVDSLPRSLIWSQEEGVFHNFALGHEVASNAKRLDFRSGNTPIKDGSNNQNALSPGALGTKEGRAYLYTDSAKTRLGIDKQQ